MASNTLIGLQPEEELLYACLNQHLPSTSAKTIAEKFSDETLAWDIVANIAALQGVGSLMYVNLIHCADAGLEVPQDVLDALKTHFDHAQEEHARRHEKLIEVLAFIQRMEQKAMLLKGAALSIAVYQHPAYTLSDDIDILVNCPLRELSQQQLDESVTLSHSAPFELEYGEHHDLDLNGVLAVNYQQLWEETIEIEVDGHPCFVMNPENMLIFACVNSFRKRFFHLRHLYTIIELLRAYPQPDWSLLITRSQQYGCQCHVYTALLCASYVAELPLPDNLHRLLGISELRKRLIAYLVARQSYASLADRVLSLQNASAPATAAISSKWSHSSLLSLANYRLSQLLPKLHWLAKQ